MVDTRDLKSLALRVLVRVQSGVPIRKVIMKKLASPKDFEIGKFYLYKNMPDSYECVWKSDKTVVLQNNTGYSFCVNEDFGTYHEITPPPKTFSRYVNVYVDDHGIPFVGELFSSKKCANEAGGGCKARIACIKISWTEGEGLK